MERMLFRPEQEELVRLVARHSALSEKGFALDLGKETEQWYHAIRALGAKEAYGLIGDVLCELYAIQYGKEYLFSRRCLAFEIAYHANAYFWTQGLRGLPRHVTTLLFLRAELERHCEIVDISTDDAAERRQRLMFGYPRGVRPCYRHTAEDPFDRSSLFKRIAGSRKKN